MGEPYIGEIRIMANSYTPAGWAPCNGQLMPISENDALFTLLGTTYGGDGQETFGLPNLQSRIPMHAGQSILAETGGQEAVTLLTNQIPVHTHPLLATTSLGSQTTPGGNTVAQSGTMQWFTEDTPGAALAAQAVTATGGSQPHDNMPPYLALNFVISLFGLFPSQT
jgi:microcystin-dependent protein